MFQWPTFQCLSIQSGASDCEKGFVKKFPLLAWAAWQLQFSPMACGTLRKHFTEPFTQPSCRPGLYISRNWTYLEVLFAICLLHLGVQFEVFCRDLRRRPYDEVSWLDKAHLYAKGLHFCSITGYFVFINHSINI